MENEIEKVGSKPNQKEVKLNVYQALNEYRVQGRIRVIFESKFLGQNNTKIEWGKLFKKEGFNF